MQATYEFIVKLCQIIVSVYSFLTGLIEDLVYMVTLLGKFIISIPSYLSWLPGEVVALILITFSLVVVYKILGREG